MTCWIVIDYEAEKTYSYFYLDAEEKALKKYQELCRKYNDMGDSPHLYIMHHIVP